jgi:hypothetical protein
MLWRLIFLAKLPFCYHLENVHFCPSSTESTIQPNIDFKRNIFGGKQRIRFHLVVNDM